MISRLNVIRGYMVHAYTASTLVFVTLAAQWIMTEQYELALLAFVATIIIDATDGSLARKYDVKTTAAGIDGSLLDNIVDFLSYVLLPMLFMIKSNMLLEPVTLYVAFCMFASAFGFSRTSAKLSDDGFFVGFPSYWNILVFYLYLLDTPALFNSVTIVFLSFLVFVPVRFLYVSRLKQGRTLHLLLGGIWGSCCLIALFMPASDSRDLLLQLSLVYPVFYTIHSYMRSVQIRRAQIIS